MTNRADQPLHQRKTRDRALILPLTGLILLTPPVAGIFHLDAKVAGMPFTLLYLFAVWAILIAGAVALSRQLRDHVEETVEKASAENQDPVA